MGTIAPRSYIVLARPRHAMTTHEGRERFERRSTPLAGDGPSDRAGRAAQAGPGITYIRTTFVPGDQVVLHLFAAASPEALREAVERAQLDCDRVVEVLESADDGVTTERGSR